MCFRKFTLLLAGRKLEQMGKDWKSRKPGNRKETTARVPADSPGSQRKMELVVTGQIRGGFSVTDNRETSKVWVTSHDQKKVQFGPHGCLDIRSKYYLARGKP